MKKWIWLGFAGAVVLWLLGALVTVGPMRTALELAAKNELANAEYTGAFDNVTVTFSGQEASASGKVGSQADHELLTNVLKDRIRTPGSSLNPVTAVSNATGVSYELSRLHPKPWVLVSRFNGQAIIAGVLPADLKDKAVQAITANLAGAKVTSIVNSGLSSDAKVRPANNAEASLDAKVLPKVAEGEIAVSALTGTWSTFSATRSDLDVANALTFANVDSSDVVEALVPLRNFQAAEAEKIRQAGLPPAYAAVVALPDTLHIYGLAGDGESERKLTSALVAAYPKRKVLTTAMKQSNDIRANSDWTAAVKDLPKGDADTFVAALTAAGKTLVYKDKGDQAAMQKALSPLLPATFDFAAAWTPYGNWLKPPAPPPAPAPPAPPAAAPMAPQIKVGQPLPSTGSNLKIGAPAPISPAPTPKPKELTPPSGNPAPSPVTIPQPAPSSPPPAPAPTAK